MQSFGIKEPVHKLFDSLAKVMGSKQELPPGQVSVSSLKQSAFFTNMLQAKGGEVPEFLKNA
jgi:hypothetical protein